MSIDVDGKAELTTKLAWNWAIRTPFDIRLGMAIGATAPQTLKDHKPSNGITLKSIGPAALALSIRFKSDESPYLYSAGPIPAGFSVEPLPAPSSDPTDGNAHLPTNPNN
jgi:hypothetical protein